MPACTFQIINRKNLACFLYLNRFSYFDLLVFFDAECHFQGIGKPRVRKSGFFLKNRELESRKWQERGIRAYSEKRRSLCFSTSKTAAIDEKKKVVRKETDHGVAVDSRPSKN